MMQQVESQTIDLGSNARISAFVISFNRQAVIEACLAPLSFADELIVIDKSSTDRTAEIAAQYSHRVITVPWSPAVEDTRAFALSQCAYEWILCLDDDECLSAQAVTFIKQELQKPRADVYGLAWRHWILGVHDERAYYWPEFHPRLFRREAVSFSGTVHGGYVLHSDRRYDVPPESGVCVHHLSHRNVTEWIAKTNRYTSMRDRVRAIDPGNDLIRFAHERIDLYRNGTRDITPDGYPIAVALLRATYDIIDRLKTWEEEEGLDGDRAFSDFAASHKARFVMPTRDVEFNSANPPQAIRTPDIPSVLRDSLRHVRAMAEQMRDMFGQRITALEAQLGAQRVATDEAGARIADLKRQALAAAEREANAAQMIAELEIRVAKGVEREANAAQMIAELEVRVAKGLEDEANAKQVIAELGSQVIAQGQQARTERDQAIRDRDAVLSSTAWQITWPIRVIGNSLPTGVRRGLRAGAKLGWWSLTLKLPRKLHERRAALALAGPAETPSALQPDPSAQGSSADESTREATARMATSSSFPMSKP